MDVLNHRIEHAEFKKYQRGMLKEEYGCGNQQASEYSKLVLSHIVCQEASNGLEEKNLGRRCSVLWKQVLDVRSFIFKIPEFSEFTNWLPSC